MGSSVVPSRHSFFSSRTLATTSIALALVVAAALAPATSGAPGSSWSRAACPDADGDTWADCSVAGCDPTGLTCGDCDDGDPDVNPGETESCNHLDDDCDGAVDEGAAWLPSSDKWTDPQAAAGNQLGNAVATVGDVDSDGVDDFVVGSPLTGSGRVVLISGADGQAVCRTSDGASGEYIGAAVAGIGDVTGDGVPDFAAAVPRAQSSVGAIAIYSGAPADACALVKRCVDPLGVAGDYLGSDQYARGRGLAAGADLTGDGVAEILAGAPRSSRTATGSGLVVVFDPTNGASCTVVLRASEGAAQGNASLGQAVAGLDDVTGDGIPDFAASAYQYDDAYFDVGAVEIFSGADGTFVRRILDPSRALSDQLGYALDVIADRDGDGHVDLVAGQPNGDTTAGSNAGQVLVLSTGAVADPVLLRLDEGANGAASEYLGSAVAVVEDTDGDGVPEILAGAPDAYSAHGTRDGHAVLFSGASGAVLTVFEAPDGAADDDLGWSVAGIGDLGGDGAGDFLVGAPLDDLPKVGGNAGSVTVFRLESDCDHDLWTPSTGDCDDQDAERFPANPETCDGVDNDCDMVADEDDDGDGYTACEEESGCDPGDLPDANPSVHPGAAERCNGIDDDCNGVADDGPDLDSDSYTAPCDCDDGDGLRHPGATEVCNHHDDDCDAVDEGFAHVVWTAEVRDTDFVGNFFGSAVAVVGDVDADGVDDLAIGYLGDPTTGSWSGSVRLVSGADRSVICDAYDDGGGTGQQLGVQVAAAGDLDGDTVPDFVAAAHLSDAAAYDAGEVIAFSGADCAVLYHALDPSATAYDHLGEEFALASAGDLTGDGVADIVAGAPYADPNGHSEAGKAVVFSGADGSWVMTLVDPLGVAYDRLGLAVAGLDDLTGDGVPEIAVGEHRDDYQAADGGSVLIFSGADGSLVRRLVDPLGAASDYLGYSVAGIEDVDGDGWMDVLVGCPKRNTGLYGDAGQVVVYSGRSGTLLYRAWEADPTGNDNLGWSVAPISDVDGDGVADFVAGAPYAKVGTAASAGHAVVFSGANGAELAEYEAPEAAADDHLGLNVAGCGDLNGDGAPEVVAGWPDDNYPKFGADRGAVAIFIDEADCDLDGYGPAGLDCDDTDDQVYHGHAEVCDAKDNDCDLGIDEDEDGDGYDACAEEAACDPADVPNGNPAIWPGAPELCNGIDDDCDGAIDNGPDGDGDSYAAPCDCDDGNDQVHPGATETCNHVADACGAVDEGWARLTSVELVEDRFPGANDTFGMALAPLGDVTGDGVGDFAVGEPLDDNVTWDAGRVDVYSGADRLVWCRTAAQPAGGMGTTVIGTGDLDGDGVPDLAASAPVINTVVLYSGADCAELARCSDASAVEWNLGANHGLAPWVDVTGDGVPEILAGFSEANIVAHHAGRAAAFTYDRSAGTCSTLFTLTDPEAVAYDGLAFSLAGIEDLTGDGVPDILAGEPGDDSLFDGNGAVLLFSGADGAFVRRILDPQGATRDYLGRAVASIGDLNGDGWSDIAAGVEYRDTTVGDAGQVVVFSGKDDSVLIRLSDPDSTGDERLGWSMVAIDDVDGDGLRDVLAGARYADAGGVTYSGRAVVFSSATGGKLATFEPDAPETTGLYGFAVAQAGDLTGDGVPELLVGAPYMDGTTGTDSGRFWVYAIETDCDGDTLGPYDDCDDTDADLWRVPAEASDLRWTDVQTLAWDAPVEPGQGTPALLYDTLRAAASWDFATATCIETDGGDLTATDTDEPAAGLAWCYLVRAQNGCGEGELGTWGDEGYPRTGGVCP